MCCMLCMLFFVLKLGEGGTGTVKSKRKEELSELTCITLTCHGLTQNVTTDQSMYAAFMASFALTFLGNTKAALNIRFCSEEAAKLIQKVRLISFMIVCTNLFK